MPYTGQDWDDFDTSNKLPFTYDFSQRLAGSDSIQSAVWTVEVVPDQKSPGTDPSPQTRLSGAVIPERFKVSAFLGLGCIANVRYKLLVNITSTQGVIDDLWSYVRCVAAP